MMSPTKLTRMSGWDYAHSDVLDVQARHLFSSPSSSTTNQLTEFEPPSSRPASTNGCKQIIDVEAVAFSASPFGGARIEPDVYCAIENYRGMALRYTEDPKLPGAVRVYVESPIDWRGRSSSPHPTHLWEAGHDGGNHPPYLCIKKEFAPKTYADAKKAAEAWVRGTQHYIATGKTISERIDRGETI